jgi:hypothetical protein
MHWKQAQAPNYSKVIAEPMCFDMVRDRLASGRYDNSFALFERELMLVFQNAKAYNPPENFVYQVCEKTCVVLLLQCHAFVHFEHQLV